MHSYANIVKATNMLTSIQPRGLVHPLCALMLSTQNSPQEHFHAAALFLFPDNTIPFPRQHYSFPQTTLFLSPDNTSDVSLWCVYKMFQPMGLPTMQAALHGNQRWVQGQGMRGRQGPLTGLGGWGSRSRKYRSRGCRAGDERQGYSEGWNRG